MIGFNEIKSSLLHIFFPHTCCGCGSDLLTEDSTLCATCIASLPETNFHQHANNPVENIFWGRVPVLSATAQYYFTKKSLIQHLVQQFKYKGNRDLCIQLGSLMGNHFLETHRFLSDIIIPLPLHPAREKKRGYNQATLLCEGIASKTGAIVNPNIIKRKSHTDTQTKKGRIERLENTEGKFELIGPDIISNKHVLLVDDIITSGATIESCCLELLKAENVKISVAALCYTAR